MTGAGPCAKEVAHIKAVRSYCKDSGLLTELHLVPPSCNSNGTYKKTQCHSFGMCYCVTEDGKPIKGTQVRVKEPIELNCSGKSLRRFLIPYLDLCDTFSIYLCFKKSQRQLFSMREK